MGIFDNDYGSPSLDPNWMGLLGLAGGFAQGATPVGRKGGLPLGMTIGNAAAGMGQAMNSAYTAQEHQAKALTDRLQAQVMQAQMPSVKAQAQWLTDMWAHPEKIRALLGGTGDTTSQPFAMPAATGGTPPATPGAPGGDFASVTAHHESRGKLDALNDEGYSGKYQFGKPALISAGIYQPVKGEDPLAQGRGQWLGTFKVPGSDKTLTYDEWMKNEGAQDAAMQAHTDNLKREIATRGLDKYIGQTVGGVPITEDTLLSMMHGGGPLGTQKFLESGGQYNPTDPNQKSIADFGLRMAPQAPYRVAGPVTATAPAGPGGAPSPPPGGIPTPVPANGVGMPQNSGDAYNKAMALVAQANRMEAFKALGGNAGLLLAAGIVPQDPAMMRELAGKMLDFAYAGPKKRAELLEELAVHPLIAGASKAAELRAEAAHGAPAAEARTRGELNAQIALKPTLERDVAAATAPFKFEQARPGSILFDMNRKIAGFAPMVKDIVVTEGPNKGRHIQQLISPVDNSIVGVVGGPTDQAQPLPDTTQTMPNPGTAAASAKPSTAPPPAHVTKLSPREEELLTGSAVVQRENYTEDQKQVRELTLDARQSQTLMTQYYEMRNLAEKLPNTGWAGQTRLEFANMLDTLVPGMHTAVGKFIKTSLKLPETEFAQELTKLTTQAAGLQEKNITGRGGLGLTELMVKNNPGMSTRPEANQMMANAMLANQMANLDYIRGKSNFIATHANEYTHQGLEYTPSTEFDRMWTSEDNQKTYLAAAEALSKRPYKDWSRYLGGDQKKRDAVLGIMKRIDPQAQYYWDDGNLHTGFATPGGGG